MCGVIMVMTTTITAARQQHLAKLNSLNLTNFCGCHSVTTTLYLFSPPFLFDLFISSENGNLFSKLSQHAMGGWIYLAVGEKGRGEN